MLADLLSSLAGLALLLLPLSVTQDDVAASARELWAAGRREAAVDAFARALAARPEDVGLRRELASHQLQVHRYAAALETTDAATDALADLRAQALYLLGRYDEAVPRLDPDDPLQCLARLDALEVLGRSEELEAALPAAAATLGSDHPRLLALRGRLAASQGRAAEAAELFQRALDADPLDLGARFGLGQAWLRSGRRADGLAQLQRHRELVPRMDALDFARRAVDLAPHHAPSLALLGDAQRDLGLTQAALADYQAALNAARPDELTPIALRTARLLEQDLHQVEAAVSVLEAAEERGGDLRLAVRAGDVLARAGRREEAAARYRRALAARPDDLELQTRLAAVEDAGEPPR